MTDANAFPQAAYMMIDRLLNRPDTHGWARLRR